MDFDYNKLKVFLTVVESGGITSASKILHRTQSAVSQSLQSLEQNLGLILITWEGKRLKLTREGEFVYNAVSDRISAIDGQLMSIIQANHEVTGYIEIGVLQDYSTNILEDLLRILANFREKYPAVTLKIHFDTSFNIEQSLLNQKIDFGLLINFREHHHFHVFEVATAEHIIVTSNAYLKNNHPFHTVQDVVKADLIDIDVSFTCLTPWVKKHAPFLVEELHEKTPVLTVPNFKSIKELLLLDCGIGVVPKYLVEGELKKRELIQILPELSTLRVGVECAILKRKRERLCDVLFKKEIRGLLSKLSLV